MSPRLGRLPYLLGGLIFIAALYSLSPSVDSSAASTGWREAPGHGLRTKIDRKDLLLSYEPKDSFKTNLRKDRRYTTTFLIAGWNNQVIQIFHLVHWALLAGRANNPIDLIPILPDFLPDSFHLGDQYYVKLLPVSDVFDLPRWIKDLGMGIVEWKDLKHSRACCGNTSAATEEELKAYHRKVDMDQMAGWSTHMTGFGHFSWTPLPQPLFYPTNPERLILPNLITFMTPIGRGTNKMRDEFLEKDSLVATQMKEGGQVGTAWGPDSPKWRRPEGDELGEVVLIDSLYYLSDRGHDVHYESPNDAWALTGQYMRWNPKVEAIAWACLRKALGLKPGTTGKGVPLLIAVHIRRTDFLPSCPNDGRICLSVEHYSRHVDEVKAELTKELRGKDPVVVVTTDETDPEYLEEIRMKGWMFLDHDKLETIEEYGPWYPTLIDNIVLSMAKGLVGTEGSTMSTLAARRVRDWNNGVIAMTHKFEG